MAITTGEFLATSRGSVSDRNRIRGHDKYSRDLIMFGSTNSNCQDERVKVDNLSREWVAKLQLSRTLLIVESLASWTKS